MAIASLSNDERQTLLHIARRAILHATQGADPESLSLEQLPPRLQAPGASFVTLTQGGSLRGCIGSLAAAAPLAMDVQTHAVDAALNDYRFQPVSPEEVSGLHIEISVLSAPTPLPYRDAEDLLASLRPGKDGVIVISGRQRATFLPQVWEKVPDKATFMDMLCSKAGLRQDRWRQPGLEIFTYGVESFEETESASTPRFDQPPLSA
jgi:AmmeMemoRadiSam system protein A